MDGKSLDTGVIAVKTSKRSHHNEEGDRSLMNNYCPVSLTSVLGKMVQSILTRSIHDNLEKKYKLTHDSHYRLTKGRSCLTKLFVVLYWRVYEAMINDESFDISAVK